MKDWADLEWFLTGSWLGLSQLDYLSLPQNEIIPARFYSETFENIKISDVGQAGIYSITPAGSNQTYIGSSDNLYRRLAHHRSHVRLGSHKKQRSRRGSAKCSRPIDYCQMG